MKLTKKHLKLLEKVFAAEIEGRWPFQSKAKGYLELQDMGLVEYAARSLGRDQFGEINVAGWCLTHAGRYAYCESCKGVENDLG